MSPSTDPASLRVRRWAAPTAVALAGVLAVGAVALIDPNTPGRYPGCPFLAITGLPCPGCGSLRAVHALATGDLAAAASFNLLLVLAVPALVVLWVAWLRACLRGSRLRSVSPRVVSAVLVAVVAFGLARNLSWGAALAP